MMADEDITKVSQLYQMNINEFLYWANFRIEKNEIEIKKMKKN